MPDEEKVVDATEKSSVDADELTKDDLLSLVKKMEEEREYWKTEASNAFDKRDKDIAIAKKEAEKLKEKMQSEAKNEKQADELARYIETLEAERNELKSQPWAAWS